MLNLCLQPLIVAVTVFSNTHTNTSDREEFYQPFPVEQLDVTPETVFYHLKINKRSKHLNPRTVCDGNSFFLWTVLHVAHYFLLYFCLAYTAHTYTHTSS